MVPLAFNKRKYYAFITCKTKSGSISLYKSVSNKLRMFCYFVLFCGILVIFAKRAVVFLSTKWLVILVPVVPPKAAMPLNQKNGRCFPSLRLWVRPPPPAPFKIQIIYCFKASCKILRAAYFFNHLVKKTGVREGFGYPVSSWYQCQGI